MKYNHHFLMPVLVSLALVFLVIGISLYPTIRRSGSKLTVNDDLIRAAISQYERPAIAKDTADMKTALAQGADVNTQSSKGVTALIYCASYGNVEGVKLLLAHRADVSIRTWGGDTALAAAKREKYTAIVHLLQQAGAKE